ncbi:lysophosphatidic acid receptor 5-like [Heptranchias perlo]|uniref:lysophosphatidic acid receptor 5-like n=1 Tax=Heptranchias perlo TaxID=212740 RepID=UPI00355A3855
MEGNGTDAPLPPCKDHDEVHRLHLVWYTLLFLLGLSLNGTALWVFLRCFKFSNKTVVYMFNLAACDLLFTLALPLRIYYYATDAWPFGDVPCQIAGSLFHINMYGSCLFLACINVDRYLALVYPLKARHLRRPAIAKRACAGVWAVIVLGCVPVALAHDTSRCQDNVTEEVRCFESFSRSAWRHEILPLVLCQMVLGFLVPLGTVLYCSARVLRALSEAGAASLAPKRRRAVRVRTDSSSPLRANTRWALQLAVLMASSNSCLDPLVYYFSTEGFRNTLRPRPSVDSEDTKQRWLSLISRKSRRSKAAREGARGRKAGTSRPDPGRGPGEPGTEDSLERGPEEGSGWVRNGSKVAMKEDAI